MTTLFLFGALAGASISVLWSFEGVREFLLDRVPIISQDWAEVWIFRLAGIVTVLCLLVALGTGHSVHRPSVLMPVSPVGGSNGSTEPNADSAVRAIVRLKIVSRGPSGSTSPVIGATLHVADSERVSDANGDVRLPLSAVPLADTAVRVSHQGYLPRVLRFDDPAVNVDHLIELQPKMRIIVVADSAVSGSSIDEHQQSLVRSALETHIAGGDIELLADDELRNDIVKRLYQYSEGRALYDPQTLQKIGDFHGATHAIFWSVGKKKDVLQVECRLVSLRSSKIENIADVYFEATANLEPAAAYVGDLLLSQLTLASILSPRSSVILWPAAVTFRVRPIPAIRMDIVDHDSAGG